MKHTSYREGFTLLEILIAMALVAILSAAGFSSYIASQRAGRDSRRISDLEQMRQALEMYKSDNSVSGGSYPAKNTAGFGDASALAPVLVPTYLPKIPVDPKGDAYQYRALGFDGVSSYFGYCLSAKVEDTTKTNNDCRMGTPPTTIVPLPTGFIYGVPQP